MWLIWLPLHWLGLLLLFVKYKGGLEEGLPTMILPIDHGSTLCRYARSHIPLTAGMLVSPFLWLAKGMIKISLNRGFYTDNEVFGRGTVCNRFFNEKGENCFNIHTIVKWMGGWKSLKWGECPPKVCHLPPALIRAGNMVKESLLIIAV